MSSTTPRPGITRWLRRLRASWDRRKGASKPPDPLRSTGQVLREAREARGLGLRDLAEHTRISIAVLEALEGGWKDRLPEPAYLKAMLPLLEEHLNLPSGSLKPLLLHVSRGAGRQGTRTGQAAPFAPSTLALLSSWQSTLLYGGLVLGLLYGVNLQQQRLAAMGRLAASPIPLAASPTDRPDEPGPAFPDLHPLARAAQGQAMELLAQDSQRGGADLSLGVLQMSLSQPTRVDLRSLRGGRTQLQGLEGELSMPVLPPFALSLTPAPPPAAVRWKGAVIKGKGSPALYAVPLSPEPKAAAAPAAPP